MGDGFLRLEISICSVMCGPNPCSSPTCTWSEDHRAATEARTVMRWPKADRDRYYAMVTRNRGDAAARALVADVRREWATNVR